MCRKPTSTALGFGPVEGPGLLQGDAGRLGLAAVQQRVGVEQQSIREPVLEARLAVVLDRPGSVIDRLVAAPQHQVQAPTGVVDTGPRPGIEILGAALDQVGQRIARPAVVTVVRMGIAECNLERDPGLQVSVLVEQADRALQDLYRPVGVAEPEQTRASSQ